MSREELLREKRLSRWLAALLLAFAALGGVACEANVDGEGGEIEGEVGEGEGGEGEGGEGGEGGDD